MHTKSSNSQQIFQFTANLPIQSKSSDTQQIFRYTANIPRCRKSSKTQHRALQILKTLQFFQCIANLEDTLLLKSKYLNIMQIFQFVANLIKHSNLQIHSKYCKTRHFLQYCTQEILQYKANLVMRIKSS